MIAQRLLAETWMDFENAVVVDVSVNAGALLKHLYSTDPGLIYLRRWNDKKVCSKGLGRQIHSFDGDLWRDEEMVLTRVPACESVLTT